MTFVMTYGDRWNFEATKDDRREVFQLYRSGGVTTKGYHLKQYDGDEMQLLEDFSIDQEQPSEQKIIEEVRKRIRFYLGEGWAINRVKW